MVVSLQVVIVVAWLLSYSYCCCRRRVGMDVIVYMCPCICMIVAVYVWCFCCSRSCHFCTKTNSLFATPKRKDDTLSTRNIVGIFFLLHKIEMQTLVTLLVTLIQVCTHLITSIVINVNVLNTL